MASASPAPRRPPLSLARQREVLPEQAVYAVDVRQNVVIAISVRWWPRRFLRTFADISPDWPQSSELGWSLTGWRPFHVLADPLDRLHYPAGDFTASWMVYVFLREFYPSAIISPMSRALEKVRSASFDTSSATTAKPVRHRRPGGLDRRVEGKRLMRSDIPRSPPPLVDRAGVLHDLEHALRRLVEALRPRSAFSAPRSRGDRLLYRRASVSAFP